MKYSIITATYNQLPLLKKAKKYWNKQTFKDFEWIIADDGSNDGTKEWAGKETSKFAYHPRDGMRHNKICNAAARLADGEYLIWVMGDSYPKIDFLAQLNRVVQEGRIVNGIRINVDGNGKIMAPDWRLKMVNFPLLGYETRINDAVVWQYMTLNSMVMSRKLYNQLGGLYEGYKGYGLADWDLVMRAHYKNVKCWWANKARIYHLAHEDRENHPDNKNLFIKRVKEFAK